MQTRAKIPARLVKRMSDCVKMSKRTMMAECGLTLAKFLMHKKTKHGIDAGTIATGVRTAGGVAYWLEGVLPKALEPKAKKLQESAVRLSKEIKKMGTIKKADVPAVEKRIRRLDQKLDEIWQGINKHCKVSR